MEQPSNASSATANAGSVVAAESVSSGPRANEFSQPQTHLTDLGFFKAILKTDNQESRDRTMALYGNAFANGQLTLAEPTIGGFVLNVTQSCLRTADARSSDRWCENELMDEYMEDAGKMFAFVAGIEVPQADAGLKVDLLTRWVDTINKVVEGRRALHRYCLNGPLWKNQAAVFSFLIGPRNGPGAEASAIPPSPWLHERRQILQDFMRDTIGPIRAGTPLPPDLSELAAQYAAPRWDECMAHLQEATRVYG